MKKFLLKLFIYILIEAVIALGLNAVYLYSQSDNINSDIEAFAAGVPDNIQICNFGSSHGLFGFNYVDVREKYTCFNFALTGQSLLYDYRILQNYQDKIQKGAYVFICISYFSLFGKSESEDAHFASKNTRYYKFLPRNLIIQFDWFTNIYVNYLPSLIPDNLFSFIRNLFMRPVYVWDKNDFQHNAAPEFTGQILAGKFDKNGKRICNQEAIRSLYDMIYLIKELGANPILVTTPLTHEYNDEVKNNDPNFLNEFHSLINEIVKKTDVKYFDYSNDERYCNDYSLFMDSDHMNKNGARKFTNDLMRKNDINFYSSYKMHY